MYDLTETQVTQIRAICEFYSAIMPEEIRKTVDEIYYGLLAGIQLVPSDGCHEFHKYLGEHCDKMCDSCPIDQYQNFKELDIDDLHKLFSGDKCVYCKRQLPVNYSDVCHEKSCPNRPENAPPASKKKEV